MDSLSLLGVSSPTHSLSSLSLSSSSSSCSDAISTPGTERSLLFEDFDQVLVNVTDTEDSYIFVVGGLGYIGSHTTLELLKEGYNVVVIDDLSNSYHEILDRIRLLATEYCRSVSRTLPSLKFHKLDYRNPAIQSILATYDNTDGLGQTRSRISGVIHFAAFKSVEESISKPIPYYQNNVCGLVDFVSVLESFGIKNLVFSSSATVYGSIANRGVPLREEHCVHQQETYVDQLGQQQTVEGGVYGLTSPYGRTKWMCEAILADIARADPSWAITALRYFNPVGCHESGLLGEDPRQKPTNLIPVITSVLRGERPALHVFGTDWNTTDGTAVRDFIHVVDLARGHIAALAAATKGQLREPFRTFNLGTGRGHTVREVLLSMEKASSQTIPIKKVARREGDVGSCVAEVRRAEAELGWRTQKSLDDCSVDVWNFLESSKRDQHVQ